MPTGSFIPKFYLSHKNMPLVIYIAWWIFGIDIHLNKGNTALYLQTNRKEYFDTLIHIDHGQNDYWSPERGHFSAPRWGIHIESMHWIILAHWLEEHHFPWAKTEIRGTDIIQCMDAQVVGTIFGISSHAIFDN